MKQVSVLIVDDSGFMRMILSDMIMHSNQFTVADTAKDGKEAFEKSKLLKPDVVLLDLIMKDYDGLYAIKKIMSENPTPIVILSSLRATNPDSAIEALNEGAIDFIDKPLGLINSKIRELESQILQKIKQASEIDILKHKKYLQKNNLTHTFSNTCPYDIVAIGSSTGGTGAIEYILVNLPQNLPITIVIAQHMPNEFIKSFASRLHAISPFDVKIAAPDEVLKANTAYFMPGDCNMKITKLNEKYLFKCDDNTYKEFNHPSVDGIFTSISEVYKQRSIGILLTGMGKDGASGMLKMHRQGSMTIAQNELSSIVWGMPKAAVEMNAVSQILDLKDIPAYIVGCLD
ncbi:MAG: chemotaxis-specific protein-glutamate methyltransferase CheB [Cytophagales bacterium]|nr:chemotaxis-specific protein-glutamate methyltransferase CheB [Cytophagales bacterium]